MSPVAFVRRALALLCVMATVPLEPAVAQPAPGAPAPPATAVPTTASPGDPASPSRRPKISLVLSGGGLTHVGYFAYGRASGGASSFYLYIGRPQ